MMNELDKLINTICGEITPAKVLMSFREARLWSEECIAQKTSISVVKLRKYEEGLIIPLEDAKKLAKLFNTSYKSFIQE